MIAFRAALASDGAGGGGIRPSPLPAPGISVDELAARFLAWVAANQAAKNHKERSRPLARFRARFGSRAGTSITGKNLETFLDEHRAGGISADYLHKHAVSIRALFNQAVHKGWVPKGFAPFRGVDRVQLPARTIGEDELPTGPKIESLLLAAGRFHDPNMDDFIRLIHATGARPKEFIDARVRDFHRATGQIVLSAHKRSATLRNSTPRTIYLNDAACLMVARRCEGRAANSPIFVKWGTDTPCSTTNIIHRLLRIRQRANVRKDLTLYNFRHLYISELLMAGVDALLVSRMAGTSVLMLEKCYAHFRAQSFREIVHPGSCKLPAACGGVRA